MHFQNTVWKVEFKNTQEALLQMTGFSLGHFSSHLLRNIKKPKLRHGFTPSSIQEMPVRFTSSVSAQWAGRPPAGRPAPSGWVLRAVWLQDPTSMQQVTKSGFLNVSRRQLGTFFCSCSVSEQNFFNCWVKIKTASKWIEIHFFFFWLCFRSKENFSSFQSSSFK